MPYQIIWQVLVVLVFAALLGEIFEQFGLPSVAGALLSGLLLGPTVLNVVAINSQIDAVSTISLFFIVFLIGFQMRTETRDVQFCDTFTARDETFLETRQNNLKLTSADFLEPRYALLGA